MISSYSAKHPLILPWIHLCMFLVVAMVLVGGVTRLTESGLSIVEWKLVSGILPPLSDAGWQAEFEAYQATPEYRHINRGMDVDSFKRIFWLEWAHRLLGRLTGLVFILPLLYFAVRKHMAPTLTRRMAGACLLVGAQGTVGWLMVYSGLQDDPRVSPIRLALHLSLAFGLFIYLFWTRLELKSIAAMPYTTRAQFWSIRLITTLVGIQIILGALVAGLDAGLTYNSWPLMDGDWIPPHLFPLEPLHRNFLEHIPLVQWQHRNGAYLVFAAIAALIAMNWRHGPKLILTILGGLLLLQMVLGITTLVYVVPISLASLHQLVALALLCACIRLCYAWRQ